MARSVFLASLAAGSRAEAQGPIGRWDLTAQEGGASYPMWLELQAGPPPSGRLQRRTGHALPLTGISIAGNRVSFPMPSEEPEANAGRWTATIEGEVIIGEITLPNGSKIAVAGRRAPSLTRERPPAWGQPIDLLEGGMGGWRIRTGRSGWSLANGELVNTPPSNDLMSRSVFTDFQLRLEVNVPPSGNSGIYLRGRHEVQVADDYGKEPHNRRMGGIYGQVTPLLLPARPAGEWQSFDITLIGRRVTVRLNGVTIIDDAEIPGITGGALDSDEAAP
ncbi:MAG TPA: DUF1080 domain-containing protein, partial [Gemmatimonadales bacterium]